MFSESEHADPQAWRQRAVARSLDDAREVLSSRAQRFVDAARELADEQGSAAFTMPQVAARAGLSLKSFYRCFEGKDDLLVALLEEESRTGAGLLATAVEAAEHPRERLRAYVDELFRLLTHAGATGYAGVLVREHRRLAEERPADMRVALAPLTDLLAREIDGAVAAGAIDACDVERTTETVFGLLLSGIHDVTVGGADPAETAAHLWHFCWSGLRGGRHE